MQSLLEQALCDFQRIPGLVQAREWGQVTVQYCANRHERPRPLRDGQYAVYAFFQGANWLRIGHTGYSARFTSQHYGTNRSGSSFASDIWNNRQEFRFAGKEDDIGDWIFANVGRANIIPPAHWPGAVAVLLEAYLHYRFNPRFEGRRSTA